MTLNLTLLTTEAIYQSADFQLTDGNTNEPLHTESMKLVTVHYPDWEGFVTYTGVGRWQQRDTAEWIVEWLTGLEDASPDAVIGRLRERGTALLRDIERAPRGRRHPHTFVFAAFVKGRPRVATISNFEDCAGRSDASPSAELREDSRECRRPFLLATGQKQAVKRASRRELERVAARSDTSPARIRNALTEMNAKAAKSPEARGTVSVGCSVTSFRRDGSGFQDLTEGSTAQPRSLMNGQPLPDIAALTGINPGRARGVSFGRFGPATQQHPHPPCVPRTVTPEESDGYQLAQLTHPEFEAAVARDVNEHATVLGSGTRPGQPGTHLLCIWNSDRSGNLAGFTGNAGLRGLNRSGQTGVTANMTNGSVHAVRWSSHGPPEDLGTFQGIDSGAFAINDAGVVVGWVSLSVDPQDRGQLHYRPAAWIPWREGVFLTDFGCAWGQAVDVNDARTLRTGPFRALATVLMRWFLLHTWITVSSTNTSTSWALQALPTENSWLSTEMIPLEATRRRTHWPGWSSLASTEMEAASPAKGVKRNRSAGGGHLQCLVRPNVGGELGWCGPEDCHPAAVRCIGVRQVRDERQRAGVVESLLTEPETGNDRAV
jgi:hypothetical protein